MPSQFQTQVSYQPAPAVAGDFASSNPRASVLAGPGSLVAGASGVTVGLFAWAISNGAADPSTGETDFYNTVSNAGSGVPTGFVHREQQALITTWLAAASNVVPQGLPVVLHQAGDFWAATATTATVGQKVFASLTTGAISTGAAGATIAGSIETKWFVMSAGAVGELIKISSWALG